MAPVLLLGIFHALWPLLPRTRTQGEPQSTQVFCFRAQTDPYNTQSTRHRHEPFVSIPNVWVTYHDACHVTKSPRLSPGLSLRFSFGRVKGHTWNYCAERGRAWERGYTLVPFINPRRACAARVIVVVLSFCLSVCLSVCYHVFCRYAQQDGQ